jgi:hypothetical protein
MVTVFNNHEMYLMASSGESNVFGPSFTGVHEDGFFAEAGASSFFSSSAASSFGASSPPFDSTFAFFSSSFAGSSSSSRSLLSPTSAVDCSFSYSFEASAAAAAAAFFAAAALLGGIIGFLLENAC